MRKVRMTAVTVAVLLMGSTFVAGANATPPPPPTCELPTCVNGIEYVDQTDGTARIVGFIEPEDFSGTVIIPSVVDLGSGDLDVVSIDANTFNGAGLTNLGFVESPASNLESIGDGAFANNQLGGLVLPNSLRFIGSSAFSGAGLTGVLLFGPNVEVIGSYAFEDNVLNGSVEIPPLVTAIPEGAFQSAGSGTEPGVTDIDFGTDSILESIGYLAFAGNSITALSIPDSVTAIEGQAFNQNDIADIYFTNGSGLTTIGGSAFLGNELEDVTIPAGVTSVGPRAFDINFSLSEVEFRGPAPTIYGMEDSGLRSFDASLDPVFSYVRRFDSTQREGGYTRDRWFGYRTSTDEVQPTFMKIQRPGKVKEKKKFFVTVPVRDEGRGIEGGRIKVVFKGRPGDPKVKDVVAGEARVKFKAPKVGKTKKFKIIVTYQPQDAPYLKRQLGRTIKVING